MRVKWWVGEGVSVNPVSVSVVYPLSLDGEMTNYWLQTRIYHPTNGRSELANAECAVFAGKPGASGAEEPSLDAPFDCAAIRRWRSDNQFDLVVDLEGLAEASGSITSTDVSLTDGVFNTDSAYHRSGTGQIAEGGTTKFDAVLRTSDTPFLERQDRTEWAYQIVDGNTETGLWVAGVSTNYRGWLGFSSDVHCQIYDHNPLADGARLDYDTDPIEDSAYYCGSYGTFAPSNGNADHDHRHFDAAFTVYRKNSSALQG